MRKSLIIILISILVLSLGFLATSYYMGLQVRNNIYAVMNTNKAQGGEQAKIDIDIRSYNLGIFSSTAEIFVQLQGYSPILINLDIVHKPIMYHNKLSIFKLLIISHVSQEFLDQKKELFSHVAVANLFGPITINFNLELASQIFYKIIGFYSSEPKYQDSEVTLTLDKNSMNVTVSGQGVNLISENATYKMDTSEFKISGNFVINQNPEESNKQENSYSVELKATNVVTSDFVDTKVSLSDPNLLINYKGDLFEFIDFLKSIDSFWQIAQHDQNINAQISIKNSQAKLTNHYKDELILNDLVWQSSLINKQQANTIKIGSMAINTIADKLKLDNLSFILSINDIDSTKFNDYFTYNSLDLKSLVGFIFSEEFPMKFYVDFNVDKILGNGLLLGKLDLSDLKLYLNLNDKQLIQVGDKNNVVFNWNFSINKWTWQLQDSYYKLKLKDAQLAFTGDINLSQYFSSLEKNENDLYETSYNYSINMPELEAVLSNKKTSYKFGCNQLDSKGLFKLDMVNNGYLNNSFSVDKIFYMSPDIALELGKSSAESDMMQQYKFVLTGKNTLDFSNLNLKLSDSNFAAVKFNYQGLSQFEQSKLRYTNELNISNLIYNTLPIGDIKFENKFSEIKISDYEDLMSMLNLIYINLVLLDEDQAPSDMQLRINELTEEAVMIFLSQGLSIDNSLSLKELSNNQNILIKNKIDFPRIDQKVIDASNTKDLNNLVTTRFQTSFNLDFNKQYIEKLIKAANNPELADYYQQAQIINLINFNSVDNKASMNAIFQKTGLLLNDKPISYWQEQIRKKLKPAINSENKRLQTEQ